MLAASVSVVIINTRKEKVRNQTTYITKFSEKRREGDGQRRRRKKRKKKKKQKKKKKTDISFFFASWCHPCFFVVFFLFSFSMFFIFFFFYMVQIQWEVRNREKRSNYGSQNCEVRPWFARVPVFFS